MYANRTVLMFILYLCFVVSCGGGGSDDNILYDDSSIENEDQENPVLANGAIEELEFVRFIYAIDNDSRVEYDVGMNIDGSTVIYSFFSKRKLYTTLFQNGEWQEPELMGDNGNIISSLRTHKLLMNDSGEAALLHYGYQRVGTPDTFAVSYFNGKHWLYTVELPGTPRLSFLNKILCSIDANGLVYVVAIPVENSYSSTEATIYILDETGVIDSHTFQSQESETEYICPMSLSINNNQQAVFLYYSYLKTTDSFCGLTAIFSGSNWSESQNWTPPSSAISAEDTGKLQCNTDDTMSLVYSYGVGGSIVYERNTSENWHVEQSDINIGYDTLYDSCIDRITAFNATGNELMVLDLDHDLYANFYYNGQSERFLIYENAWSPAIFYYKGSFIVFFWDQYGMNTPSMRFFNNNGWSKTSSIKDAILQPSFYMNSHGVVAIANNLYLLICQFNDSVLE